MPVALFATPACDNSLYLLKAARLRRAARAARPGAGATGPPPAPAAPLSAPTVLAPPGGAPTRMARPFQQNHERHADNLQLSLIPRFVVRRQNQAVRKLLIVGDNK